MKRILIILFLSSLLSCSLDNSVEGEYKAVANSNFFDAIVLENGVAMFKGGIGGLMPASKYKLKKDKVYIETSDGIFVFKIMDDGTLKGENSIFKGEIYKKE